MQTAKDDAKALEKEWIQLEEAALRYEETNQKDATDEIKAKITEKFGAYDTKYASWNAKNDAVAALEGQIKDV